MRGVGRLGRSGKLRNWLSLPTRIQCVTTLNISDKRLVIFGQNIQIVAHDNAKVSGSYGGMVALTEPTPERVDRCSAGRSRKLKEPKKLAGRPTR
jgi:hypothetical protein